VLSLADSVCAVAVPSEARFTHGSPAIFELRNSQLLLNRSTSVIAVSVHLLALCVQILEEVIHTHNGQFAGWETGPLQYRLLDLADQFCSMLLSIPTVGMVNAVFKASHNSVMRSQLWPLGSPNLLQTQSWG
jgi:hypothetical protein